MRIIITIVCLNVLLLLGSCSAIEPKPFAPSEGHIQDQPQPSTTGEIPELVEQLPVLPEPEAPQEQEKYTVVVNEVPVKELLFALARDANVNIDIDPSISGVATINAVEQTLPQLLDRIARQVALRYELQGQNLFILPDEPFYRNYKIDYLDLARTTDSSVQISTQIASTGGTGEGGGGGGGGNTSTTSIDTRGINAFWANLVAGVTSILSTEEESEDQSLDQTGNLQISDRVVAHPETGLLTVKATAQQHALVQEFVDNLMASANRQVLLQATIVEVELSDRYQAGIDWSFVNQAGKAGFDFISTTLTGVPISTTSSFLLNYQDPNTSREEVISATIRLLEEFGNVNVLSSPQIMALNNQSAILKVVDNIVYFQIEQETNTTQGVVTNTFETTVKTVPVGIVMSMTPQINENDSVIINVRPTISRVTRFVNDPNPALTLANPVPEIRVREMESILRMNNGQIAVLGGLMQDNYSDNDNSIPGLSKIPGAGEAFKTTTKEYLKSELVIFLRPVIVRNPSLDGDLKPYKKFLRSNRS